MSSPFDAFLSQAVVLDTGGPMVFLGTLREVNEAGFVLVDADVHDCRNGHATAEEYVNEARLHGVSPNRRRVLVMRAAVVSLSRLDEVVEEQPTVEGPA